MKKNLVLVVVAALIPLTALAQQPQKAGEVTYLDGKATFTRGASTAALQEKQPVQVNDTVKTEQQSLVKMLLGGKALVTVRELSSLTITELPNKVIVDMTGGRARFATRPKENIEIEIRTPNAIASVRGSSAIVEVPSPTLTHVESEAGTVLGALRGGTLSPIPPGQGLTFTGSTVGSLRPIRPAGGGWEGKKKPGQKQKPDASAAAADVSDLGGGGGSSLPGASSPFSDSSRILPGGGRTGRTGYVP